jgi:hypothetical protein
MKKILLFLLALAVAAGVLIADVGPALADGPGTIYLDDKRTSANEDGTKNNPYNTLAEATAMAQASTNGARIYVKNASGQWVYLKSVASVQSGASGAPLPVAVVYALLFVLALALIGVGWRCLRGSRQRLV